MAKLIILAIAVWLIITILKRYRKGMQQSEHADDSRAKEEPMVQCAHCGVHLPKSESIHSNSRYYCSEAHVDALKNDEQR